MPEDVLQPPESTTPTARPEATPLEDFFASQIGVQAIIHDGRVNGQTEPLTVDTQTVTIDRQNVAAVTGALRQMLTDLMVQHKLRFPVTVRMQNMLLNETHEIAVPGFVGIPAVEIPDAVPYVPPVE